MNALKTQSHAIWDCTYHLVIVPKYRKKVLFGSARKEIGEILRQLAKQKGIEIIKGNALPDHIHMVISIPPRYSVSHMVGFLKGKSAIAMHNRLAKKKKILAQKNFWSRDTSSELLGSIRKSSKSMSKINGRKINTLMVKKWI